jgi:ParB family chromosome partitioning protein
MHISESGEKLAMNTTAIAATGYQTLTLDQMHESSTNPRRTFEPLKLSELAESLRTHGLIQPVTVRPHNGGFEIVAGARRFRAAQIAQLAEVPVRILDLTDEETVEIQIIENSQRAEVHPYEEATGYQRLLAFPGYDVAAVAGKCGKSQSHIYARLALLQLVPEVAEAFQHEKITASHANLIARLPQDSQAEAFEACWRKDYQDTEPHLLPAKHLAAWIQENLYLALADAPFDLEDPTLNPTAGACVTCPRRSGYNTSLFPDVAGDQCLQGNCFQMKISAHLDRAIAARPDLVQIENGWRSARDRKPGAVQPGHFREIEPVEENPDAEPAPPCAAAKTAIIIYGNGVGTTLSVCTDNDCPVHDPRAAAEQAADPVPTMEPAKEAETEEEAEERKARYQQQRKEYEEQQERKAEARRQEEERQQKEYEAERARKEKLHKARLARFDRILDKAPATFSATQLRVFLRALVNLDPYSFVDDVAKHYAADDENNQQTSEEILLSTIDGLADDKLTRFALHLILTGHTAIPHESEIDFLTEAEAAFAPSQPKKMTKKKEKKPTVNQAPTPKKTAAKKKVAA